MEAVGAAAGVLQVAQIGVELSKGLYKFAADFKDARQDLERIAEDTHVLAIVLEHVSDTINSASHLWKPQAFTEYSRVLTGTDKAFSEVKSLLDSTGSTNASGKLPVSKRAQWALGKKNKMELLRANLAQLKSSLDLLLHVLQLSIGTHVTLQDRETISSLRADIEKIHIEKEDANLRYNRLFAQYSAELLSNSRILPHTIQANYMGSTARAFHGATSNYHNVALSSLTICACAVTNLAQTIDDAFVAWKERGSFDPVLIQNQLDHTVHAVRRLPSHSEPREPNFNRLPSSLAWGGEFPPQRYIQPDIHDASDEHEAIQIMPPLGNQCIDIKVGQQTQTLPGIHEMLQSGEVGTSIVDALLHEWTWAGPNDVGQTT